MPRIPIDCEVDGCPNKAARGRRCWTHVKRQKRGIPAEREVRGYRMTKQERLSRALARHALAEAEDEYKRALNLVEKYASGATSQKGVAAIVRRTVDEAIRRLVRRLEQPKETRRQGG